MRKKSDKEKGLDKYLEKSEKLENFVVINNGDGINVFLKHVKKYTMKDYIFLDKKQVKVFEKLNALLKTGIDSKNKFFNFFSVFVASHGQRIVIQVDQYKNIDKEYSFDLTRPPDGRLMIRVIRDREVRDKNLDKIENMVLLWVELDSWFPIKIKSDDGSKDYRIDDLNKNHNSFYVIKDLDTSDDPADSIMYNLETRANYIITPFVPKKSEKLLNGKKKK